MASKIIICLVLAALVACASAQFLQPIAGARDLTGGYYDNYSGQYSSALTGRVYNTAPVVAAAPILAHHAPILAGPAVVAAPALAGPILAPGLTHTWIRR